MLRYILLLSLTYVIVISVSPGDEHEECAVPDYNENVNVLLDSWRYNALLDEPSAVWATDTDDNNNSKRVRETFYTHNHQIFYVQYFTNIII